MVEKLSKSKSKGPRAESLIGSDEEEDLDETPKINHNLMFGTTICSIAMSVLNFALFCYYVVSFFSRLVSALFHSSGGEVDH